MTNCIFSLMLAVALLLLSLGSNAAVVYQYTGNNYTIFGSLSSAYNTTMSITGSFTVDSELIAVSGDISGQVTSYNFSDGVTTYTDTDPEGSAHFIVNTNGDGDFVSWIIDIFYRDALSLNLVAGDVVSRIILQPGYDDVQVYQCDFIVVSCIFSQIDGATAYQNTGDWSVVPTPSVALLIGAGLVSLSGFARRKKP